MLILGSDVIFHSKYILRIISVRINQRNKINLKYRIRFIYILLENIDFYKVRFIATKKNTTDINLLFTLFDENSWSTSEI